MFCSFVETLKLKDMKKINDSKEIVIGKEYLFEETNFDFYFKKYPAKVRICRFDGRHFWADTTDDENLADSWEGFTSLCLGSPEDDDCDFYELPNNN